MGQTLSSPVTTKHTESGESASCFYSISDMQGWRISMEDAHAAVLDLDGNPEDSNRYFAVYDGHGGGAVAKYAGQNVHKRLTSEESYQEKYYEKALKRAFLGTDEDLLSDPARAKDTSGCTAVAALYTTDNKIYVANSGDSRAVIGVKGEVKPLSFDHKPTNEGEKARIVGAGGFVDYGRVNGNLALSRALGDFEFKKNYALSPEAQVITADPDIICHDVTEEDEFMVLACDGIWDCMTSQQVIDFVRYKVSEGKELTEISEMMCEHCLAPDTSSSAGIGCDNMTVLIVALTHGRTKEDWYAWITDRVKNNYGYNTPSEVPQLYAHSRLMAFRARREAKESAKDRTRDDSDNMAMNLLSGSGLGSFASVLNGGVVFTRGPFLSNNDNGPLMFGSDDSDEEESDDSVMGSVFGRSLNLGRSDSPDLVHDSGTGMAHIEEDDDSQMENGTLHYSHDDEDLHFGLKGDAPLPSKPLPNGDQLSSTAIQQLDSTPGGDAPSAAVEAEGFLDKSEDPLKF